MTSATTSNTVNIMLYSDNIDVRQQVREALGSRIDTVGREIDWLEVATGKMAVFDVEDNDLDLIIADGETYKLGAIGLCRQLKEEIENCPPILILIARPQDAWLATWSEADAVALQPVDPFELERTVTGILARS